MSKRTDTFLFVLIQKISSVGVQTGVVLYGCVTLLMTSFDVQQHHGAARHFTSVSAIAQEQIFPNWDMPANCWWCGENLVEFGRIDLEAERLNRGVLKRKTDLRGDPFIWIWCPDSESNQGHGDFQSLQKRPNALSALTVFYWFALRKMFKFSAIWCKQCLNTVFRNYHNPTIKLPWFKMAHLRIPVQTTILH